MEKLIQQIKEYITNKNINVSSITSYKYNKDDVIQITVKLDPKTALDLWSELSDKFSSNKVTITVYWE